MTTTADATLRTASRFGEVYARLVGCGLSFGDRRKSPSLQGQAWGHRQRLTAVKCAGCC